MEEFDLLRREFHVASSLVVILSPHGEERDFARLEP
jgi:hypothetical protein